MGIDLVWGGSEDGGGGDVNHEHLMMVAFATP